MPRGGWRGGGRPRIHLDETGDHTVRSQLLLTEEADDLLEQLRDLQGGVSRSEMVRLLIMGAAKRRKLKARAPAPKEPKTDG